MLCTINAEVGGVATDQKSRSYNVMCSIQAIATAAAGSTPTVNPVNSTGTRNTSHNCITVLANTEAGGWTTGISNHYSPSSTFNASAATQYLDLYRPSGKSSYPWLRVALGHQSYPFNSAFTSYPAFDYSAGCTTSDPSSIVIPSSDTNWLGPMVGSPAAANTACGDSTPPTSYPESRARFDQTGKTYTVAATANYLIITNDQFLWYFGVRSVGGWEVTRTDNPSWVHLAYTRYLNGPIMSSQTHSERVAAWSSGINASGTQTAATIYGNYNNGVTTSNCAITGLQQNTYSNRKTPGSQWNSSKYIRTPIIGADLYSNYGSNYSNSTYDFMMDAPVADTITGLNVPPAYPVVINCVDTSAQQASNGVCPGIFKGMAGKTAYVDNFVTASSYVIGTDTYIPIRTGHVTLSDLWFIRSA